MRPLIPSFDNKPRIQTQCKQSFITRALKVGNIGRGISRTLSYALCTLLMKGISLIMVPFIASHLTIEAFGQLELLATLGIVLSVIIGFGLEDALFRYCGVAKSTLERAAIAAHIYTLALAISVATLASVLLLAPLFAQLFEKYASGYLLTIVLASIALEGAIAVPMGWLRMQDKVAMYCTISCLKAGTQAALVWHFLQQGRGIHGVFEAGLIATFLVAAILLIVQLRATGLAYNRHLNRSLLSYTLPIVLSGLLAFCLNGFDKWILVNSASLSDLAQYAIAAKFGLALTIALQPYGMWWSPMRFSILSGVNGLKRTLFFTHVGIVQIILAHIGVGLLAPVLILLLFPSDYHYAALYIPLLLTVVAVKEIAEFTNIGCFAGESTTKQLSINLVACALAIPMMLVLTPTYSVNGILISLLTAQVVKMIWLYRVSLKTVELQLPILRYCILLLISYVLSSHFINTLFSPTAQLISNASSNIPSISSLFFSVTMYISILLCATGLIFAIPLVRLIAAKHKPNSNWLRFLQSL